MFSSSGSSGRTRVGKRGASKLLKSQEISTSLDATAKGGDTATVNISPRQKRARVVVRQAKEADYEQVASIRAVIIPVGMDGATGFMGKKVVIKDPAEAKRRRLMAKVWCIAVAHVSITQIGQRMHRIIRTLACAINGAHLLFHYCSMFVRPGQPFPISVLRIILRPP